ncbi:hypothetical protein HC251_10630 [Iamia sp. SCSIO 61187]|uniref:hypothetical protein n=1 Tax=Iamia sp. SCSIO 61187 TaxID=2722752 RepID=UPI001C63A757|nr:hypothetical protein [Iamia sp. SCSIO 61187]QYG92839.1 hypothetical protein HC251_10630 [Iamia sp. SCSIO 61187]
MSAGHLVRRFLGSLAPRRLSEDEAVWVASHLQPAEAELWGRMSRADRRHAVGVARRAQAALGDAATRPVMAAALLHDVGKVEADLGTYGRVMATLSAKAAGRGTAHAWSQTRGITRRIGLYLLHEELGADLLALAGSDPLTVTLVREWSVDPADRTAPAALLDPLRAADDA